MVAKSFKGRFIHHFDVTINKFVKYQSSICDQKNWNRNSKCDTGLNSKFKWFFFDIFWAKVFRNTWQKIHFGWYTLQCVSAWKPSNKCYDQDNQLLTILAFRFGNGSTFEIGIRPRYYWQSSSIQYLTNKHVVPLDQRILQ